jgi:hypothetical protein
VAGGDRIVADRLDRPRLAARQADTQPSDATDVARTANDSRGAPAPDEAQGFRPATIHVKGR